MISMEHHQHFDRSRAVASSSLSSSWLLSSSSSSTSSSSSQDGEDGTEPMQSDTFDDEDEDYASSSPSSSLRTRRSINCKARFLQQQHAMMLTPLHIQPILRRGCPVTYANVKASTNSNVCSFSSSSMLIVECEEPDEEDLVMTTLTQSSNTYDSRAIAFSSSPLRPAFLPPRTSPTHDDDDEKQDHYVSFQDLLHTIEHDDDEDEDGDVDEEEYGIVQQGRRRRSSSTVTLLESIPEEDDATDEDTG